MYNKFVSCTMERTSPLSFFFWPFHCLSFFGLRLLITPLLSPVFVYVFWLPLCYRQSSIYVFWLLLCYLQSSIYVFWLPLCYLQSLIYVFWLPLCYLQSLIYVFWLPLCYLQSSVYVFWLPLCYLQTFLTFDDNDVRLYWTDMLGWLFSTSSREQQSAGWHVVPLGHIILIPSQLIFAFTH